MECQFCKGNCQKAWKQKNGAQKLYCKRCHKYQQPVYKYKACQGEVSTMISHLVCESVGIRGIARFLQIGINTVLRRILSIADGIAKPVISRNQPSFEVDELWTYIGRKENEYWLAYALNMTTGQVVDFLIGKRTKATLKMLIDNLLASGVRKIRTDRLTHYQRLKRRGSAANRGEDSRSEGCNGSLTHLLAICQSRAPTEGIEQAAPKGCPTAPEPHFVWPGIALLPIHSPAQPCVIAQ